MHVAYIVYMFVSFLLKDNLYLVKAIQVVIIVLSFVKLLFYLRIFKQLSFLIQMLLVVFVDMKHFLFFFGIVVTFFSITLSVLLNDDLTNYEGVGPVGYFIVALRQSIGDFDTIDSITGNSDYKILIWIVYLGIVMIGNVVFMNFIIAVVSQSYENCMQKSTAQSYKVKL
jgi:hypothetical protein